ncbi:MAG: hypothetical protein R3A44_08230 [Caldilineaceae bacterium]
MKIDLLLLIAVLLPPQALTELGEFVEERTVETPYGAVGPLALRRLTETCGVWIQPYSGLPTRTDPRATVQAAHQLGVGHVINWDTGVAVNPELQRGETVIAVDYIDWTRHQPFSFGRAGNADGAEAVVGFAPALTLTLHDVLPGARGAIYLATDGPRRETPAEARMFRAWGVDVIGHNLAPEVALANELGLSYAGLVTISDRSADQSVQPVVGAVRAGLEQTIHALPKLIKAVSGNSELTG